MFCSNCGKELNDNATSCPYCGLILLNNSSSNKSEKVILDLEYGKLKKDAGKAGCLWFFFGAIGLHRLYIQDFRYFAIYTILLISDIFVSKTPIPNLIPYITWVVLLFDACCIYADVEKYNTKLAETINNTQDISEIPRLKIGIWAYILYVIFACWFYGIGSKWFMNYWWRVF